MKLQNKIGLLLIGTILALAGINLIIDSETTKNFGAVLALAGVLTDIVVLITLLKNEKWLAKL
ncbi:hypothetical protein [Dyadobacter frigoris]|uniref:Gliding motility protein GldL n=1 Tax=Dyadobacter frigoris TaxID=2576211 RepID=A0A4U6D530_9BACT|nr:hypothetical protein [Dyadobacter frigoris]TKT91806.1 hypothetical protein FDK13_11650 [Dyadobacter frigoris]GLU53336.1 hypothetical protein Dfri01_27970 [Dyadobacter frigoris]